jgi:hypothetical protein
VIKKNMLLDCGKTQILFRTISVNHAIRNTITHRTISFLFEYKTFTLTISNASELNFSKAESDKSSANVVLALNYGQRLNLAF